MMEKRELTCIGCPLGCSITVTFNGKEVTSVTGNTCSRGAIYAKKEVTDPTRIVTSSVRVTGGTAPVRIGDVILSDVCGTHIPVVATKNIDAAE